jgi:hypothetical protein
MRGELVQKDPVRRFVADEAADQQAPETLLGQDCLALLCNSRLLRRLQTHPKTKPSQGLAYAYGTRIHAIAANTRLPHN